MGIEFGFSPLGLHCYIQRRTLSYSEKQTNKQTISIVIDPLRPQKQNFSLLPFNPPLSLYWILDMEEVIKYLSLRKYILLYLEGKKCHNRMCFWLFKETFFYSFCLIWWQKVVRMNVRLSTGMSPGRARFSKYPFYTDRSPLPCALHFAGDLPGSLGFEVVKYPISQDNWYLSFCCPLSQLWSHSSFITLELFGNKES